MPTTETAAKAASSLDSGGGGEGDAGGSLPTLCQPTLTTASAGGDGNALSPDKCAAAENPSEEHSQPPSVSPATSLSDITTLESIQAELAKLEGLPLNTDCILGLPQAATSTVQVVQAESRSGGGEAVSLLRPGVTIPTQTSTPAAITFNTSPPTSVVTLNAFPSKKVITLNTVATPGSSPITFTSLPGSSGLSALTTSSVSGVSGTSTITLNVGSAASMPSGLLQGQEQSVVTSHPGQQPIQVRTRPAAAQKRLHIGTNPGQSLVTKVILTENPETKRPQAVPVVSRGGQLFLSSPAPHSGLAVSQPGCVQQTSLLSPTKLVSPSPTKSAQQGKITLSPLKGTRITMVPVSGRSPQKIAPAPGQVITMVAKSVGMGSGASSTSTITSSKSQSNFLVRQPQGQGSLVRPVMAQQLSMVPKTTAVAANHAAAATNVHQVPVTGSKFQYVRLVTQPTATPPVTTLGPRVVTAKSLMSQANKNPTLVQQPANQMKITLPVAAQPQQVLPRPASSGNSQRILLPANSQLRPAGLAQSTLAQIRPAGSAGIAQLPPGTTIISPAQSLPGMQGFALVPAQYVTQLQQPVPALASSNHQALDSSGYIPISSSGPPAASMPQPRTNVNGNATEAAGQRPRKPCNCTKSQCLKLYCDCFANGEFCHNCNCNNCFNNLNHEEERARAIKACLDRNPNAFRPKIGKSKGIEGNRRHNKGCNCKRSGCLKNYCECYEAKILCSHLCKCIGCKNYEESPDRKTLMHLQDTVEGRVNPTTSVTTKITSQIQELPPRPAGPTSGERLPFTFVTREVAEATCACLVAQAEEAERTHQLDAHEERMILEEFGRCLMQVIESSNRTKAESPAP